MGNCDPVALQGWLRKRYKLLFLGFNERTDHAFAIVDSQYLPPGPVEQPFDCEISLSTPRQAESDFLRMPDFDQRIILFDSKGWKKRLLEIARN
jgi:hypothetical protein